MNGTKKITIDFFQVFVGENGETPDIRALFRDVFALPPIQRIEMWKVVLQVSSEDLSVLLMYLLNGSNPVAITVRIIVAA
jgi:hypothetical protein